MINLSQIKNKRHLFYLVGIILQCHLVVKYFILLAYIYNIFFSYAHYYYYHDIFQSVLKIIEIWKKVGKY